MELTLSLRSYDHSRRVEEEKVHIPLEKSEKSWQLGDGLCTVQVHMDKIDQGIRGVATFSFLKSTARISSVAVEMCADDWTSENYVFMPGAVYNGNRFACQKLAYPPYAQVARVSALSAKPVITDIPRLNIGGQARKIELRAGDMTTPAVGYFDQAAHKGFLLMTEHKANGEYTGIAARENPAERTAYFEVSVPAVREETKYSFGGLPDGRGSGPSSEIPSDDTGRVFRAGEKVKLPFAIYDFASETLHDFFLFFNQIRTCMEVGVPASLVPFGKAYNTVKEKYEHENFICEGDGGYFAVGTVRDYPQQCWQAGWIGGGMNNYAFMLEDEGDTRNRALDTFRFIFDHLQRENGWVCGIYAHGVFYGDAFDLEHPSDVLLIRKNADLLYFMLKEYMAAMEQLEEYKDKLQLLCNAFIRLYRKYGQIGQFINTADDSIEIGNSACGAIACAALALAYEVFGERAYLETAEELGALYEQENLNCGILNGCPGEICQAPDSEAAFALLEGYVQLYETTGKKRWLNSACKTAEIAMTWVMSYDFEFPHESTAAKLGAHTMGTVFANAQNKHSAPGICTLSGNSLLKLYRFTKDEKYLRWLQSITRALMQFVSLPERPVFTLEGKYLPAGYTNERVQTSDWEGKHTIGEFAYGSNWPEVSIMLTYVEVPGIYVDIHAGCLIAFDSLSCGFAESEHLNVQRIWVKNETAYDTTVTLLADDSAEKQGMTHNYFARMQKLEVKAGEKREIELCF